MDGDSRKQLSPGVPQQHLDHSNEWSSPLHDYLLHILPWGKSLVDAVSYLNLQPSSSKERLPHRKYAACQGSFPGLPTGSFLIIVSFMYAKEEGKRMAGRDGMRESRNTLPLRTPII